MCYICLKSNCRKVTALHVSSIPKNESRMWKNCPKRKRKAFQQSASLFTARTACLVYILCFIPAYDFYTKTVPFEEAQTVFNSKICYWTYMQCF